MLMFGKFFSENSGQCTETFSLLFILLMKLRKKDALAKLQRLLVLLNLQGLPIGLKTAITIIIISLSCTCYISLAGAKLNCIESEMVHAFVVFLLECRNRKRGRKLGCS